MAPKPKVHVVLAVPAKQIAKPKGLQYSAAQWKAYDAAYNATAKAGFAALAASRASASNAAAAQARAKALQASVATLRNSRLQAAYSMQKVVAAQHARVSRSAIATFAAKMSMRQAGLAHQNQALQTRIAADYTRHLQQTVRAQWAYAGEKVYAHQAVMATLTTNQATTLVQAQQAAALKTAKKAAASTSTSTTAASSAAYKAAAAKILAQAKAAGAAAAARVPPPKPVGRPKGSTKATSAGKAKKKKTTKLKTKATRTKSSGVFGITKNVNRAVAAARKQVRAAPRPAGLLTTLVREPFGDPLGNDCVAAAIATHLDFHTAVRLDKHDYAQLVKELGDAPVIEDALALIAEQPLWWHGPKLCDYQPAVPGHGTRLIAGFQIETGHHAALLLSEFLVMSWGEFLTLSELITPGTQVDEAWQVTWEGHKVQSC